MAEKMCVDPSHREKCSPKGATPLTAGWLWGTQPDYLTVSLRRKLQTYFTIHYAIAVSLAVSLRWKLPTYFTIHYAIAVVQPGIPIPPPQKKSPFPPLGLVAILCQHFSESLSCRHSKHFPHAF